VIVATVFSLMSAGACYVVNPHLGAAIVVGIFMWVTDFARYRPRHDDRASEDEAG
jgi:hypothetical protein